MTLSATAVNTVTTRALRMPPRARVLKPSFHTVYTSYATDDRTGKQAIQDLCSAGLEVAILRLNTA